MGASHFAVARAAGRSRSFTQTLADVRAWLENDI
jgi:hypothetical protein